jgi:hypothetical protein
MTGGFDFLPSSWSSTERDLYSPFETVGAYQDLTAQALYHEGYFNMDITSDERAAIREALDAYMDDVYDVDFDDLFDWVAWRDAYEGEG